MNVAAVRGWRSHFAIRSECECRSLPPPPHKAAAPSPCKAMEGDHTNAGAKKKPSAQPKAERRVSWGSQEVVFVRGLAGCSKALHYSQVNRKSCVWAHFFLMRFRQGQGGVVIRTTRTGPTARWWVSRRGPDARRLFWSSCGHGASWPEIRSAGGTAPRRLRECRHPR